MWICRRDFTAYADVCFREFGDRVSSWSTINEPNIFAVGGYDQGVVPPGRCSYPFGFGNCSIGNSSTEPYLAAHNMLLAHASAVRLYKNRYQVQSHLIMLCIYFHKQIYIYFLCSNNAFLYRASKMES